MEQPIIDGNDAMTVGVKHRSIWDKEAATEADEEP